MMKEKITQKKHPYLVVEIENNPATTEFDSYFFGANFTSEAMNFIESALDALEIGDEPVTITVTLVGLNEKQVEFIAEYGREGFDKIELEMLADEPSDEEGE